MFILARIPQRNKSSAMEVIELGCEAGEAVQRARKACSMQISIYMEEVTDDSRNTRNPERQKSSVSDLTYWGCSAHVCLKDFSASHTQ